MEGVPLSTQFTGDMACSVLCTNPKNKDRWSSVVDSAGSFLSKEYTHLGNIC